MKNNKKYLLAIAAIVVSVIFFYSMQGGEDKELYIKKVEQSRREKDRSFKNTPASPLPDSLKFSFKGLSYYPVDLSYKVNAKVLKFTEREKVQVPTSDGKRKDYIKFGFAEFKLKDNLLKVLLLEPVGEEDARLLVAFADETSAKETYGGGRYIDVDIPSGNSMVIDFNKAYNPFCAYNAEYSCPLPPKENILMIPVEAGEKNFHE